MSPDFPHKLFKKVQFVFDDGVNDFNIHFFIPVNNEIAKTNHGKELSLNC
jgi:hypothetical protein